ncbi:MAG: hypothetical protein KJ638_01160 [Chloroflexi bacterium]|nr:hypothetical protein [Chloroflexota bacterium]
MSKYTREELDNDWEFKILRSASGAFRKPELLETLLEEEALAGWEMVEKFDNSRIRFKRLKTARKRDPMLPDYVNPYRTQYGGSVNRSISLILAGLVIAGVLAFGLFTQSGSSPGGTTVFAPIAIIVAVLIVLIGIFAVVRAANR